MTGRSIGLLASFAGLLCACSKTCPSIASDRQWQSIVAKMNLPEYKMQRLNDYVATLDASGCNVSRVDRAARTTAAASLDTAIGRSLPLFVPADQAQEAHDYLKKALGMQ